MTLPHDHQDVGNLKTASGDVGWIREGRGKSHASQNADARSGSRHQGVDRTSSKQTQPAAPVTVRTVNPGQTEYTYRLQLPAWQVEWTETGIPLTPGDRVTVHADGIVTYCRTGWRPGTETDAAGGKTECPDPGCGTVQAEITGHHTVVNIGREGAFSAGNGGELLLVMYDNPGDYGDNRRSFDVTVTVIRHGNDDVTLDRLGS